MSRFTSAVSVLATLGCLLSGLLVFLHYYPGLSDTYFCHGTFWGNCNAVNESNYGTLFGLPLAAYGLFFYLTIWSTMLVTDIAQGHYCVLGFLLLFPLVILALLFDSVLLLLLIKLRHFCFLCFLTYVINLSLGTVFLLWYKWLVQHKALSAHSVKAVLQNQWWSPERKVASSVYLLPIVILGIAVFSVNHLLKIKTSSSRWSQAQIERMLRKFYSLKVESINFPPSYLTVGPPDARVKIIAFTDFLCPPCRQLFALDRKLSQEYGPRLSFAYYNFPLDNTCNPYVEETSHPYSCLASKAALSSGELNVFEPYLNKLLEMTNSPEHQFSRQIALKISGELLNSVVFIERLDAAATSNLLRRDIDLAEKLKIQATPTLFIDGRRIDGMPQEEVIESIIRIELAGGSGEKFNWQ